MTVFSSVAALCGALPPVAGKRRCHRALCIRAIVTCAVLLVGQSLCPVPVDAQTATVMQLADWEFHVGPQIFKYTYEEPDIMKETGISRKGLRAVARYNQRRWSAALEGSVAGWDVDYDGHGTLEDGTVVPFFAKDIPSAFTEGRLLAGYNIRMTPVSVVTLFAGGGLRIKTDDISRFSGGYRRNSRYWYIPLGVDYRRDVDERFRYEARLEFDYLAQGRQLSYLSDLSNDAWSPDDQPFLLGQEFEDAINMQNSGYGFRISNAVVKARGSGAHFELRIFYRRWSVPDSELSTSNVTVYSDDGSIFEVFELEGYEPKNTTSEWGLSGGLWF